MKPKFIVAAMLLASCCVAASAASPIQTRVDSLKQSHKVITFGSGQRASDDSIQQVINMFYEDQFRNAQDPDAPYFMFMSKDASMAMGIGGSLRVRGWYDWGGYAANDGFVTSEIPMNPDPASMRALKGNVAGSRLYFKVLGNHSKIGRYQVYLEAKFNGGPSGRAFKLSKAYATIGDWTVGYANSTFEDPAAQPFTVDMQGPNSEVCDTDVLVRWMHKFGKNFVLATSLEMPNADDANPTDLYKGADGYIPNIGAFYQYQWGSGEHIRLSGIMRFLSYRDLPTDKARTELGWGLKLSSVFTPGQGPLTVYLNGMYGKGIASITNDLGGLNLDLLGNIHEPGHMYAPAVFGYYAGLQYNFSPSVFASASFSELRFLPSQAVAPSTYRYGLYGDVNLCWYVTPRVLVGAEFDLGCLKEFSMQKEWAHRVGIIAQLSF